jgi:hypothetical protein
VPPEALVFVESPFLCGQAITIVERPNINNVASFCPPSVSLLPLDIVCLSLFRHKDRANQEEHASAI